MNLVIDYIKINLTGTNLIPILQNACIENAPAAKAVYFSACLHTYSHLDYTQDSSNQESLFLKGGAIHYINECMKEHLRPAVSDQIMVSVSFISFYEVRILQKICNVLE